MKYIVLLCDGMADLAVPALNGKTPMDVAKKPNMDKLAKKSRVGLVKTVEDSLKPGSDVANMSVLGYNPLKYYTGRSPLEALSIGINMKESDVSFRCNLVTLSDEVNYIDKTLVDYCADDITTAESNILIKYIEENFGNDTFAFYSGVSYRHCLIWNNGRLDIGTLTPPHDITGQKITNYLEINEVGSPLLEMMKRSYDLLNHHPVNEDRRRRGLRPANSIWLWGEGKKANLPTFYGKYHLKGTMISAVDLLKGIGKLTGMNVPDVEGATGYIDTNFKGKADAAISALKNGNDFVYIHVEAPDECGHRAEVQNKVRSIELIDLEILAPLLEEFANTDVRILICPDHPTPLTLKTHTNAPVPFLIYDSTKIVNGVDTWNEQTAAKTGIFIQKGDTLMDTFLE